MYIIQICTLFLGTTVHYIQITVLYSNFVCFICKLLLRGSNYDLKLEILISMHCICIRKVYWICEMKM